ncbi:MAG TPA: FkbM family methyltransferase [Thermoanaerobaculia bacterium]|jgi:FkbM family methyltransferase
MTSLRLRLGRLRAFLWRFHTLPLAHRLFDGTAGPRVLKRPFCGFDLHVDVSRSNPQQLLYLEGERFVPERTLLRGLLRSGMRAVDVGANIGYYLLLLESAVGAGGSVACFEPEPENLRELERNIRANRLENVQVFAAAVGAEDSRISMRTGINAAVAGTGEGEFTAPLTRLDSALTSPVDFVKIDVEGYEGHVLEGARRILRDDQPALFVEIHPGFLSAPYTVDQILGLLAEHYASVRLFEISPQAGFLEKLKARYLRQAVRPVPDREALLASCRAGRREEPFWAVCTP